MKRTNIYLSERQEERLKKLSKEEGLSVAEIVRRAIDYFLEKKTGNGNHSKPQD